MGCDWVEQFLVVDGCRTWCVFAICVGHVVLGKDILDAFGLLECGGACGHVVFDLYTGEVTEGSQISHIPCGLELAFGTSYCCGGPTGNLKIINDYGHYYDTILVVTVVQAWLSWVSRVSQFGELVVLMNCSTIPSLHCAVEPA